MKKNLGMFLGLPRWGARAVLPALFTFTAACVLSVSSAQAAIGGPRVLLDWASGAIDSQATGVSTTTLNFNPGSKTSTGNDVTTLNSQSFTVSITADAGFDISGLSVKYTLDPLVNLTSITVGDSATFGSQTFTASGNSTAINLSDVSEGTSQSETFTLSGAAGPGTSPSSVTFSDIQFDGIVTLVGVPEPVNHALAGFGLIFVGVGAGRFYLGRRRLATAS